jgi:hypothetical protein
MSPEFSGKVAAPFRRDRTDSSCRSVVMLPCRRHSSFLMPTAFALTPACVRPVLARDR